MSAQLAQDAVHERPLASRTDIEFSPFVEPQPLARPSLPDEQLDDGPAGSSSWSNPRDV